MFMFEGLKLKEELPIIVLYLFLQIPLICFVFYETYLELFFKILVFQVFLATVLFIIYTVKYNLEKKMIKNE